MVFATRDDADRITDFVHDHDELHMVGMVQADVSWRTATAGGANALWVEYGGIDSAFPPGVYNIGWNEFILG